MGTLDGVELTPCERCNAPLGASEYTVTKGAAECQRTLCEKGAEITAETYPVRPVRKPARARSEDETPPAASTSTSRGKQKEE